MCPRGAVIAGRLTAGSRRLLFSPGLVPETQWTTRQLATSAGQGVGSPVTGCGLKTDILAVVTVIFP